MAEKKKRTITIRNKSDKPDNVVMREVEIDLLCRDIESELPGFLRGYFTYLKNSVLPMTRLAYMRDIRLFFRYLINETGLTRASDIKEIKLSELNEVKAADVNMYLEYCRSYPTETDTKVVYHENGKATLSRKKSSVSMLFKFLYREELVDKNITDGFDPIRMPKPGDREIKALQDDEVMKMLDAVSTGSLLTDKERQYWEKTKKRDKAILILFLTYGLRLSELYQLNVSSFNFSRGEFKIYRKRGKESLMPLNNRTVLRALDDYLINERPLLAVNAAENEDAMFLSLQGTRMTERQIRSLVKKYTSMGMETSRRDGYSPHKLRATAATSLIGRGNSIYDVQALMDHDNVTTTQLYAAHTLNVKRDLIKNFEWDDDFTEYGKKRSSSGGADDIDDIYDDKE